LGIFSKGRAFGVITIGLAALVLFATAGGGCARRPKPPPDPGPVVLASEPAGGSTGVAADAQIGLRFDRPMDIASVAERLAIDPAVEGCWSAEANLVSFQPVEPLRPGTTYRLTLSPGAAGLDGVVSQESGTWSFTVAGTSFGQLPALRDLPPLPVLPGVRALVFGRFGELYAASDEALGVLPPGGDEFQILSTGWWGIEDIAVDHEGRLWLLLAQKEDYRVVRLDEAGHEDRSLPLKQPVFARDDDWCWFYPRNLAALPDGDLLVLGTDRVRRLDPVTGEVKQDLGVGALSGAVTEGYFGPSGLVLEIERGTLHVNNGFDCSPSGGIVSISLSDGEVTETRRVGTANYHGLARDRWGNFYLVSQSAEPRHLLVFGPSGDPLGDLIDAPRQDPHGYLSGKLLVWDDVLYICSEQDGTIIRYALSHD